MRGLTIVLAEPSPARFRAALSIACASTALGARTRLFLQEDAVGLLGATVADDARHMAAGLPTLAALHDEALAMGVEIGACQSGLALTGLSAAELDPRITTGGLVALLASLGEDRLITA